MRYLTVEHILWIHDRIVKATGGDPAILDVRLIESAAAQPRMTFDGQPLYQTVGEKAAALGFSLNRNHGFADGNKRTSHAVMEVFLRRNGYEISAPVDEQEEVFLNLASGRTSRAAVLDWLNTRIVKREAAP